MQAKIDITKSTEVRHFANVHQRISTGLISESLGTVVPAALEASGAAVILIYGAGNLGWVLVGTGTVYFVAVAFGGKRIRKQQEELNKAFFALFGSLFKRLDQYKPAHDNGNVVYELEQLDVALVRYASVNLRSIRIEKGWHIVQSLIVGAGFSGLLYGSVTLATKGKLSLENFVSILLYLVLFSGALDELSQAIPEITQAYKQFVELVKYYGTEHDLRDDGLRPALDIDRSTAKIEFKNVSLRYPGGDRDVLKNITFAADPGTTTVVVGDSGVGKSSLFNMLSGYYDATGGVVCINGQDIATVNRASLRDALAIVPQDATLSNESIHKNVKYANRNATPIQVNKAIRGAQLTDAVTKLGEDQAIGEGGQKLSGGQKQRVSLARAMLRDSCFVLIDEPTASLDSATANIIMRKALRLFRDVTVLIITHDFGFINEAYVDQVVVIDKGRIVENDSVRNLLDNSMGFFSTKLSEQGISPETMLARHTDHNGVGFWDEDEEDDAKDDERTGLMRKTKSEGRLDLRTEDDDDIVLTELARRESSSLAFTSSGSA